MEYVKKEDLIEGEIYTYCMDGFEYLVELDIKNTNGRFKNGFTGFYISNKKSFNVKPNCIHYLNEGSFKTATLEEKHWLETCITANKFIPFDEAIKTFLPEYVECIGKNVYNYGTNKIGKIYKVINQNEYNYFIKYGDKDFPSVSKKRFKPSTKEAYEAQFIKSQLTEAPEIFWVKVTDENKEVLNKWRFDDRCPNTLKDGYIVGKSLWKNEEIKKGYNITLITKRKFYDFGNELSFEDFKRLVLKETIEPNNSKFIDNNTVETSEGSIFVVGDYVTPFESNSPNKGKKFKITGFRWNNAKTEICAITDLHKPYGIGVDKLELYIEPKKNNNHFFYKRYA